jgi:hypothetical protein
MSPKTRYAQRGAVDRARPWLAQGTGDGNAHRGGQFLDVVPAQAAPR